MQECNWPVERRPVPTGVQVPTCPGRYRLTAPLSGNEPLEIEVKSEAEIVRDIALKNRNASRISRERSLKKHRPANGVLQVRECTGMVSARQRDSLSRMRGRFQVRQTPGEYVLYAISENGLAGFAPLAEKATEVKVIVSPSTTVSGRVVDSSGKPLPGRMVGVALAGGSTLYLKSMYFSYATRTDDQGRFTLKGARSAQEDTFL